MPKPSDKSRPVYSCYACGQALAGYTPADVRSNLPQICKSCWDTMSAGERAARSEAMRMLEALRDVRTQLDILNRNSENDESQLGSIAKAFENFGRILKSPAGEFDDLIGEAKKLLRMLQGRVQQASERDKDDDEPWRESLRDSD